METSCGVAISAPFADDVVFIDLAPLSDPDLLPATVAAVLGITPVVARSPTEAIASTLRRSHSPTCPWWRH